MSNLTAKGKAGVTVKAVVTRANGTMEDLGMIASTKKENVVTNLIQKIK